MSSEKDGRPVPVSAVVLSFTPPAVLRGGVCMGCSHLGTPVSAYPFVDLIDDEQHVLKALTEEVEPLSFDLLKLLVAPPGCPGAGVKGWVRKRKSKFSAHLSTVRVKLKLNMYFRKFTWKLLFLNNETMVLICNM